MVFRAPLSVPALLLLLASSVDAGVIRSAAEVQGRDLSARGVENAVVAEMLAEEKVEPVRLKNGPTASLEGLPSSTASGVVMAACSAFGDVATIPHQTDYMKIFSQTPPPDPILDGLFRPPQDQWSAHLNSL